MSQRLLVALTSMWAASVEADRRRLALVDLLPGMQQRARVQVLRAFSRAQADRMMARLRAVAAGRALLLPVVDDGGLGSRGCAVALELEIVATRARARRLELVADVCRQESDLASAWVAEQGRLEEQDAVQVLHMVRGMAFEEQVAQ